MLHTRSIHPRSHLHRLFPRLLTVVGVLATAVACDTPPGSDEALQSEPAAETQALAEAALPEGAVELFDEPSPNEAPPAPELSTDGTPDLLDTAKPSTSVAPDGVASADLASPKPPSFVPAYFLYSIGTGQYGPCANRVGTLQGRYSLPYYHYNTPLGRAWSYQRVYVRRYSVGQYKYTEYRERAFTTAWRYLGCYRSYPAWGYYGDTKVSRLIKLTQFCRDSCNAGAWSYGSWRGGW